jgi:hypothetical protein
LELVGGSKTGQSGTNDDCLMLAFAHAGKNTLEQGLGSAGGRKVNGRIREWENSCRYYHSLRCARSPR